MGKDKGGNRTKAKASSSAKAASLIQSTGFVGFSSGRIPGGSLLSLNPQLQMSLKKSSKKDTITRIKAFQELEILFPQMSETEYEPAIDSWVPIFTDLGLEYNFKVRETGLKAHIALIKKVGRNLAPYLRSLAGPWLVLMHDEDKTCSELAYDALSHAIPPQKHVGTWIYCKSQVIEFLQNRLSQSQQSLCEPLGIKGVEAQEIYERTIAGTISSLNYLITFLPKETAREMEPIYIDVLTPSFWKHASSKSASIRRATFTLLRSVLSILPNYVECNLKAVTDILLKLFQEKDSSSSSIIFPLLSEFFQSYPQSLDSVNEGALNQFKEQLCNYIKSGSVGRQNTSTLIIDFLRSFPEKLSANPSKFVPKLLQSMWRGIDQKEPLIPLLHTYMHSIEYLNHKFEDDESLQQLLIGEFLSVFREYSDKQKISFPPAEFAKLYANTFIALLNHVSPALQSLLISQFIGHLHANLFPVKEEEKEEAIIKEEKQNDGGEISEEISTEKEDVKVEKGNKKQAAKKKNNNEKKASKSYSYPKCSADEQMDRMALVFAHISSLSSHSPLLRTELQQFYQTIFSSRDPTYLRFLYPISDLHFVSNLELEERSRDNFETILQWSEMAAYESGDPLFLPMISVLTAYAQLFSFDEQTMSSIYDRIISKSTSFISSLLSSILKYSKLSEHSQLDQLAIKLTNSTHFTDGALPPNLSSLALHDHFELLSILLFGTNMNPGCLINQAHAVSILQQSVAIILRFISTPPTEESYRVEVMQQIAYLYRLIIIDLNTHLKNEAKSDTVNERYYAELEALFEGRICAKYYWKPLQWTPKDWRVSPTAHGKPINPSDIEGKEVLSSSIISKVAQYGWNKMMTPLPQVFSRKENLQRLTSQLITGLLHQVSSTGLLWFNAPLFVEQAISILELIKEDKEEQRRVIDQMIGGEEQWVEGLQGVDITRCINLFKYPIQSHLYLPPVKEISTVYPRQINFTVELIKHLQVEELLGKERLWLLCHLLYSYSIYVDVMIPPIDHASEKDEEWALCKDSLLSFCDDSLFPYLLSFIHPPGADLFCEPHSLLFHLIQFCFTLCEDIADELILIKSIGFSTLIKKMINGSSDRAHSFYHQFLTGSRSPHHILENHPHIDTLIWPELILPEVIGSISPHLLLSLSIDSLQELSFAKVLSFEPFQPRFLREIIASINWLIIVLDTQLENNIASRYILQTFTLIQQWCLHPLHPALLSSLARLFSILLTPSSFPLLTQPLSLFLERFFDLVFEAKGEEMEVKAARYHSTKLARKVFTLISGEDGQASSIFSILLSQFLHHLPPPSEVYTPLENDYFASLSRTLSVGSRKHTNYLSSLSPDLSVRLIELLAYPHAEVQKAACTLISKLIDQLPSFINSNNNNLNNINLSLNDYQEDQVVLHPLISNLIQTIPKKPLKFTFDFSDHLACEIPYYYQSDLQLHLNYLLSWILLITYVVNQPAETRKYAVQLLKKKHIFAKLLRFLFSFILTANPSYTPSGAIDLNSIDPMDKASMEQLISEFYLHLLTTLPSLVRHWWTDECERNTTGSVESYTTKYISPSLIRNEISKIASHDFSQYDNFDAKGCENSRRVTATYDEDDTKLTIILNLPLSYPLNPIEVEGNKTGVPEAQWRKWLLSMHTLLFTQDASLLDAILLWKNSMDKLFEGIESCLICYSVFHQNGLPRLGCKTCHNKFHSACLYKWFNSSHKSNCPLCQTPWQAE